MRTTVFGWFLNALKKQLQRKMEERRLRLQEEANRYDYSCQEVTSLLRRVMLKM